MVRGINFEACLLMICYILSTGTSGLNDGAHAQKDLWPMRYSHLAHEKPVAALLCLIHNLVHKIVVHMHVVHILQPL